MFDRLIRWAPEGSAGGNADGGAGDGGDQDNGGTPASWESVLETLDDSTRALYDQHVTGLRNTVQATRQERDALKARVDAIVQGLDGQEPEAIKKQLTGLQGELQTANQRASFYEEAGQAEIACRNPRAAFLVAQAENLFDSRGNPDWNAIKTAAPELFGARVPPGNAGAGTSAPPAGKVEMNDWIRQSAGRG